MREMFPMTEEERIGLLRKNLQSDVDKRLAKRDTAAVALDEAQEAEDMARGLLAAFDHLVRERASQRTGSAMEAVVELKRNAEKDGIGLSFAVNGGEPIVVTEAPAVDPITGEVTNKADAVSCDTCGNMDSCNSRQREGSGGTGCSGDSWEPRKADETPCSTGEVDEATGAVRVTYPGEKHAHITDVGSCTQYAELVADYLATLPAVSPHRDDPVAYYRVIGVDDEIDRDLRGPVAPDDYGVELAVVRRVDVQEANELLEDAVR